MPALGALAARGVRARLRSTCPPVSAPAWVTFLTGKQPGKHGVFNFQNLDGRRYSGFSETLVNSSYFRGDTLLDHLGRVSAIRALSYRIPMTYPAWDVPNAVVVAGPPLDLSLPAYFRRLCPKINFPPQELRRHKTALLARVEAVPAAAAKIVERWGRPDDWGRGQVAALVFLARHPHRQRRHGRAEIGWQAAAGT